jgi:hypothetical protein
MKTNPKFDPNNAGDRLVNARRWLEIIESNIHFDNENDGATTLSDGDRAVVAFTKEYIKFLEHGIGINAHYADQFERRCELVSAVRQLDDVYAYIDSMTDRPEVMPQEASVLLKFLSSASLEMSLAINNYEHGRPDLAKQFATERSDYQRIREYFAELASMGLLNS